MKRTCTWFRDLLYGVQLHPIRFAVEVFAAFSVQWTLIEGVTYMLELSKPTGCLLFGIVISISIIAALWRSWRPRRVSIQIGHTNSTISVSFGDIFKEKGIRAIGVNEFFDSEIGKPVSGHSLHGLLLSKCFGGHPEAFDKEVERELQHVAGKDVNRTEGKTKRYPIGTTALIRTNTDKYLLFALSRTDPATCKAKSDVPTMWKALDGLWSRARLECGGEVLHVPLVGSGLAGVGPRDRELLDLIILSVINASKAKQITKEVNIVIWRGHFNDIDLRQIKQHWIP